MKVPDSRLSTTRRRVIGSGLVAVTGLAGCTLPSSTISETTSKSFDVDGAGALAVETRNGNVAIQQGEGDGVSVDATKRTNGDREILREIRVVSERSDGTLTVRVDRSAVPDHLQVSVDLDLSIPSSLAVQRVATTNGDVSAADITGDGTYRTENGDLDLENVDGSLTLRSTNGDVIARDVTGVDGATSTNGDIELSFTSLRSDATLSSTNGDVTASVPADLDAAVELRTTNGDVTVEELSLSNRSGGSNSVTGRLGDGGHTLAAETTNGDVTLSAR